MENGCQTPGCATFGDAMESALWHWLEESGFAPVAIAPLPGDLSQRQYSRAMLASGDSLLVASYPPPLRPVQERFLAAHRLLVAAGVAVPAVLASSASLGLMALEDLGDSTLHDLAKQGSEIGRYVANALVQRSRIAALDHAEVEAIGCPPLDAALLRRELDLTFEHLFEPRGIREQADAAPRFRAALHDLCDELGGGALVPCHRDFMVRNLMPRGAAAVFVLDFQDLRPGPPAYDLASLLNDSWFVPAAQEKEIVATALPREVGVDAYRRAVVQRCLKAAGTFARFAENGNPRHLPLIAPTLERALPHLAALPETARAFSRLAPWWRSRLAPESFC